MQFETFDPVRYARLLRGHAVIASVNEYLKARNLAQFPFCFIVTYGRSGSTLLQGLLNALPAYCIRGENNGSLIPIYRAQRRLFEARTRWGSHENGPRDPWYGAYQISPEEFLEGCGDTFLRAVIRPPIGTRCCGFKEIRYTNAELGDGEFEDLLNLMCQMFPGAAFVFNVRDIEATAKSGWWKDQDLDIVRTRLANARDRMLSYAKKYPERSYVFSYDVLQRDIHHFAEICDFLGERFDATAVRAVLDRRHSVIGASL